VTRTTHERETTMVALMQVSAEWDAGTGRWLFAGDGLEEFADGWGQWEIRVSDFAAVVVVEGEHAGLIAMDWLRDRGIEVTAA
jgi:hypothetical protein